MHNNMKLELALFQDSWLILLCNTWHILFYHVSLLDLIVTFLQLELQQKSKHSRIGFYSCPQKNLSELVYDASRSGSYVEAALFSIGVSNEQLVQNMAEQLAKISTQ